MPDYDKALSYYQQTLDLRKKILHPNHPDIASTLSGMAGVYQRLGRYDEAASLLKLALAIVFEHIEHESLGYNEHDQLVVGQAQRFYLDNLLRCALRSDKHADAAFRAVLAWKGSTLVRQRAARMVAESPELQPVFDELQSVVSQIAALSQSGEVKDAKTLENLARRREHLEVELNEKAAAVRLAAVKAETDPSRAAADMPGGPSAATLESLTAVLPADGALVDYLEFWDATPAVEETGRLIWTNSLVAFVVRPGKPVQMFNLGAVDGISQTIDSWRESYGMSLASLQAGALLKARLWTPLEGAIGDAKTVLISPDGALGRLPFAALPGKAQGNYLIDEFRLALAPVPQLLPVLVNSPPTTRVERELLLLGNVDYDHRAGVNGAMDSAPPRRKRKPSERILLADTRAAAEGATWGRLDGAAAEVAVIEKLYNEFIELDADDIVDLSGAGATEEQFRLLAPQCYQLHLATHGFFASEDKESAMSAEQLADAEQSRGGMLSIDGAVKGLSPGLLSGLVFAGANNPPEIPHDISQLEDLPDDGILTADEIAFLPLGGVKLAVLSACESGLGQTAGGEGLLGIQRAFQVSGAKTTIASLWKVSDSVTRQIMEQFYRNYLEHEMSPLDALREAQLWALRNPELRGANAPADEQAIKRLPPKYWAAFTLSGDWR
jgi:CHAT domain-containing protein